MRKFGLALLVLGLFGFVYASPRAKQAEALPAGTSLEDHFDTEGGRWEMIRYGAAGAAALGLVLALFPKGR